MSSSSTTLIPLDPDPAVLPNEPDNSITTIAPTPPKPPTTWTCRLPVELISIILEYLVEDKALGTLARVQSTSRALYSKTTPLLYRHITINQFQAAMLFSLFVERPSTERHHLNDSDATDLNQHLIDRHPLSRLRTFLSETRTVNIEIEAYVPDNNNNDNNEEVFERCGWLGRFEASSLWPMIEGVDVHYRSQPPSRRRAKRNGRTRDILIFAKVIAMSVCSDHVTMTIDLDVADYWYICVKSSKAIHIEVKRWSITGMSLVPQATDSLTLHSEYWPKRSRGLE